MARHTMPMAVALAAIIAASMAAAGAHAQPDGNVAGTERAAGSLWDAGHAGSQYADLGHISPQPMGGHDDSARGGASHAAHQQAPPGSDGSDVSAKQAPESEWDTGYIGDQYADLGHVSQQPPGGHDDAMAGSSSPGAAGGQGSPGSDGSDVSAKQAPESEWDTGYGDQYADLGHVSQQPPGGHDDAMAGSSSPGAAGGQAPPGSQGGNDVRSEQAAESLWDTSRIGDQYADLGPVSPQPPGDHDGAMTGGMAPGPSNPPADDHATKVADELDTMRALIRSMGAETPEVPDATAATFNARLDAINAQGPSADAAGKARLAAQARAVLAEYGLAALALATERTPEVERATEFLTRLAALHTRHAEAIAAGAPPGEPPAGLDALYAEYGLRHAPDGAEPDAAPADAVELVAADGSMVRLTGERAAEFLRRSDALAGRYADAYDMTAGNRTAAIAAVEADLRALYAEFGASFGAEPAPSGAQGGNDVRSEQAAESLWDTSMVGEQYADLGSITPQPPGDHDGAMTGGMAPGPSNPPADDHATKVADELDTMRALIRSMGAETPEVPDATAATFNARLDAINAQGPSADAAGKARLAAQARAIVAEYGLAALALATERTPEVERATEFLTRLAALHTAHAEAIAAGAPPGEPPAGLDALYAEYGLRHAPAEEEEDPATSETLEFEGPAGQVVTLTGERAAEFLRRSDALAQRYSDAIDTAPSASRDAALDALEIEYATLLAEYGIAAPPPAQPQEKAEDFIEFTRADGQVVRLEGDRAAEFLRRSDDIGARYSDAYSSVESASRTAALDALEAEHDALLAEFGLGPGQGDKGDGQAQAGTEDAPATGAP